MGHMRHGPYFIKSPSIPSMDPHSLETRHTEGIVKLDMKGALKGQCIASFTTQRPHVDWQTGHKLDKQDMEWLINGSNGSLALCMHWKREEPQRGQTGQQGLKSS